MTTLPGEAQITAMVESWAVLSNIIEAHISEYHKDQQRHMDRWEIDGDSVVMHCSTYRDRRSGVFWGHQPEPIIRRFLPQPLALSAGPPA